jgi:hypothetical protein
VPRQARATAPPTPPRPNRRSHATHQAQLARVELPLPEVVQVVVRAVVPLAGALFLRWSAGNVLFIYCADTLASMYAVCVLACARLFAFDAGGGPACAAATIASSGVWPGAFHAAA